MPELPEVETFARTLSAKIAGRRLACCRLIFPPLMKSGSARGLARVVGRRVERLERRGKYLVIRFEGGWALVFHLKMTGKFQFVPSRSRPDRHTRLVFSFEDFASDLHFRDIRKFGCLHMVRTEELPVLPALAGLGPEPLGTKFADFETLLRGRKGRLKSLLLNQSFIAGIGNIYADEILFRAGLHPLRSASHLKRPEIRRLWSSMRVVLRRAIDRGGSSIRDYSDPDGRPGRFQESHRVYGRGSEPCRRCGARIRRIVVGGRSSFYCPKCQR